MISNNSHIKTKTLKSVGVCRDGNYTSVRGRLSACVPDVAMAPNANTHLLTARDYMYANNAHAPPTQHAPPTHLAPPPAPAPAPSLRLRPRAEYGGGLQLDLGDGATHTPRPGQFSSHPHTYLNIYKSRVTMFVLNGLLNHLTDYNKIRTPCAVRSNLRDRIALSCVRSRNDDDELRAAIELSVIRAYSSLAGASAARSRHYADLLPPDFGGVRSRATPSPSSVSAGSVGNMGSVGSMSGVGNVGGVGMPGAALARRRIDRLTPPPRLSGEL
ncbi:hypothetical protein RR48_01991 [Papilio machaon]|uniref:Uncharacterized protein n=1 Tax=Papilio machaon TaxID=76193 RepID=A0A0N1IPY0_PAPMA|nr:hypothetical protein RR48_01991 [Papilio machaon]